MQVFERGITQDQVILMAARASRTENQDAIDTAIVGMLADPKEVYTFVTSSKQRMMIILYYLLWWDGSLSMFSWRHALASKKFTSCHSILLTKGQHWHILTVMGKCIVLVRVHLNRYNKNQELTSDVLISQHCLMKALNSDLFNIMHAYNLMPYTL